MDLDFDPENFPKDVLEAIGYIAQSSAYAEYVVEQGIGGCVGIDIEYTAALTTHMASPQRDHALRAAAEIRLDNLDELDLLDDLLDELKKALEPRNNYVHNSVCLDKKTKEIFIVTASARGSVDVDLAAFDTKKVRAEADRILAAARALYTFLGIKKLLPPIPPKPRPRDHKLKAARKKRRALLKDSVGK